jgi:hypothetical protein
VTADRLGGGPCPAAPAEEDTVPQYRATPWLIEYAHHPEVAAELEGLGLVPAGCLVLDNGHDMSLEWSAAYEQDVQRYFLENAERPEPILVTPDGTITAGDSLIIDTSKLSAIKNGVEIDYAGGFPRLAVGQNTITVVLSSGSISLTVRRRHRYL